MTPPSFLMRSKLFVPAIRPDLYQKALASSADAICFDLEDAVPSNRKVEARTHLKALLVSSPVSPHLLFVRTNHVHSTDFAADLAASVCSSLHTIALPKVESPDQVFAASQAIAALESALCLPSRIGILPTIESPRGIRLAAEIAASSPRIVGLQIGFADLLEPLGISPNNQFARNQLRLTLRLAAAEAGLDCYDSAFPNLRDTTGFSAHLAAAHAMGFAGSSCIHPSQIAAANQAFTPSPEALAHARRIVDAAADALSRGEAVTQLDGHMIDRPFILQAQRLLARAPKGGHTS
jgi:citrate lyase beta subunit